MKINDFFDDKALSTLRSNLQEAEKSTIRDLDNYWEDEDSITGALSSKTMDAFRNTPLDDFEIGCSMHKLRGRGKNAEEKKYGADVILTTDVFNKHGELITSKVLPIQAKKKQFKNKDKEQLNTMGKVFNTGSGMVYTKEGIKLDNHENIYKTSEKTQKSYSDYLVEDYIGCKVGRSDIRYDKEKKVLKFIANSNLILNIYLLPKGFDPTNFFLPPSPWFSRAFKIFRNLK